MDERLSSYALIARAAIDVTVPLLTGLFSERFLKLHQVIFHFAECISILILLSFNRILSFHFFKVFGIYQSLGSF